MSEAAGHLIWVLVAVGGLWLATLLTLRGAGRMSRTSDTVQALLGTLVLGVGTNLPELAVAIAGAARLPAGVDASGIVVGSATGSAVAQTALVLGAAGAVGSVIRRPGTAVRAGIPLAAAALLVGLLAFDGSLTRGDGFLLLSGFVIHAAVVVLRGGSFTGAGAEMIDQGLLPGAVLVGSGAVLAAVAAHGAVVHAVPLADAAGASRTLVGVLIVGLGASLPELVIALGAALGGRPALALGAALGNATFDLLVPLGAGALVHPLAVAHATVRFDLPALLVAAALALLLVPRTHGTSVTPRDRRRALALAGFFLVFAVARIVVG